MEIFPGLEIQIIIKELLYFKKFCLSETAFFFLSRLRFKKIEISLKNSIYFT